MRPVREEIDLHRLTVDEAIVELDEYLHTAYQAGLYHVWIIHGKGTGILRREVGDYLSKHPLVKSHRHADLYHGGIGATEVALCDT